MKKFNLFCGDSLEKLKLLPDNSVDSIVCDPPYGISFMNKKWDYDVPSVEIWKECLRVLKPGGYLLAFAGTRTQHRMATRIEDAGFEIRDMIAWVYGSGFPKSMDVEKAINKQFGLESMEWSGWGTALKPALEPITMARKPLDGTTANNVLLYGTGGLNIEECRIPMQENDTKGMFGVVKKIERFKVENTYGKYAERIPADNSKGRFPSNLILDAEAGSIIDGQSGVTKNIRKKNFKRCYLDTDTNTPGMGSTHGLGMTGKIEIDKITGKEYVLTPMQTDAGGASRFFYCAKADTQDRNEGLADLTNVHPTVKPTDLMRYLCRLVTPVAGVVLDPFCGSGSTGKAAIMEGFNFIGIDLDQHNIDISKARITYAINRCEPTPGEPLPGSNQITLL